MSEMFTKCNGFIVSGDPLVYADSATMTGQGTVSEPFGVKSTDLFVQEPLYTGTSGNSAYIGWRPDETVLYSGYENIGNNGSATYNLTELPTNFNKIKIYWCLRNNSQFEQSNKGVGSVEYDTNLYSADYTYIAAFMEGATNNTAFQPYRYDANIANIRTTTWTQNGQLTRLVDNTILDNNAQWFHIYKIVGINRKV